MALRPDQIERLENFFNHSSFSEKGAIITDLDGTAVHESDGKIVIHHKVELGLKKIYDLGRPVIINTLRFPLSVIRTFGLEWYKISNAAIPVVLLNGSQLGYIGKDGDNFVFEQLQSFVLEDAEINGTCDSIGKLLADKIDNLILFCYFENWRKGEIIWTPDAQRIPHLKNKYASASAVISSSLEELRAELLDHPLCMMLLLIDLPGDKLMAYQHTRRSNFITRQGVNKLCGSAKMAELLGIELHHSIGAGDTDMDNFLKGVGLSVHVNNPNLPFHGVTDTIRLNNFIEYGDLLFKFAEMQKTVTK